MTNFALDGGVGPNIGGFIEFVTNVMTPPAPFDPTTSIYIPYAYNFAYQWVNSDLQYVNGIPGAWNLYSIAVYNLAADTLIAIAQDPTPYVIYQDGLPYWQWLRKEFNVLAFIPGIVQTSSDEGTSVGYMLPEGYANYTIANIQNTKTPYGRAYLGIASSYGTLWGLS